MRVHDVEVVGQLPECEGNLLEPETIGDELEGMEFDDDGAEAAQGLARSRKEYRVFTAFDIHLKEHVRAGGGVPLDP